MLIHSAATIRRSRPVSAPDAGSDPAFDAPSIYLPSSTKFIHDSVPVRAYPGIDLDFQMTGYDWFNRTLVWSLDTYPTGMTINSSTGVINWTPSSPSQDGDHSVTVRMKPGSGIAVTKSFTINVNTSGFIFVATTGNDTTGTGLIGAPYATLDKACDTIVSGTGKTIYLISGTYTENFDWQSTTGPLEGKTFSWSNSVHIRAYPGDTVTFSGSGTNKGPITNGSEQYIIWDRLILDNYTHTTDDGILLIKQLTVAKRCTINNTDSADNNNCCGFCVWAGGLVHKCYANNNRDTTPVTFHNSSNYKFYGDLGSGESFILECESDTDYQGARSPVGFKIKHGGSNGVCHLHNSVAYNIYPASLGQDYSSIRHNLLISVITSGGSREGGIVPKADTGTFNNDGMLIEHNVMLTDSNANESSAFTHGAQYYFYSTTADTGVLLQDNDIYRVNASSQNQGVPIIMGYYSTSASMANIDFKIKDNNFYADADTNIMRYSNTPTMYSVSGINGLWSNSGNTYAGTVPATINFTAAGKSWTYTVSTRALTGV